MNCQRAQALLSESLDHSANAPLDSALQEHLAGCPACQRDFDALNQTLRALDTPVAPGPPPSLRRNFYAMLEREKLGHSAATPVARELRGGRLPFWRRAFSPVGVCALLVVGFVVGRYSSERPPHSPAGDELMKRELAELRQKMDQHQDQLNTMTRLVGYSILQQQQNPANERLQDVLLAAGQSAPTDRTLDDLVAALTLDPSPNVRLRAAQALHLHDTREFVRAGVVAALPREQNPLVQLELIDFVATAKLSAATPALERIAADRASNETVRGAAQAALAYL